tara:strand:- start:426 stop:3350 length:2925 start_codon:yes stop_codon:yes gene_type:complete
MKYLRVLFVEDNPLDVELLIRHIKKGDFEIEYDIATSLEEVSDLTDEYRYDICICDYNLPGFSGIDAVKQIDKMDKDIPVILVSGTIPDEQAIDALLSGAKDYVLKDNLGRLLPAMNRELDALEQRREKRKNDKLLNAIFDGPVGVRVSDQDQIIVKVNKDYCEIVGYTEEELLGQSLSLITPVENKQEAEDAYKSLIGGEDSTLAQVKEVKSDGSFVDILVNYSVEKTSDEVLVISTIQDVSDLLMNKSFLEQTSKSAGVGGWEYHIETDVVKMSPKIFEIFEMDDRTDKNAEQLISIYHEDDRDIIREALVDCITNKVPKSLPLRINGLKGTKKYVRLTFDPFVVNDVTVKLYGSLKDVTEEKILESEIEQREQRYRFLFDNNPNPLIIVDDSGSEAITDVNFAATELYGYTKEEFVSMTTYDLRPSEDHEMFQNIVSSLGKKEKEGVKSTRTKHLKKSGELIIVDVHWKRISLGGVRNRLILLIDITEKAMFEQELIKTNTLLKTLIDSAPIGVVTVSTEGIVEKVWNAQAENIFGWTNEEADGNFLPYALREKKAEAQNYLRKVAESGKTELITIERETKKGDEIVLREYLTPILGKDGEVEKIMLLIEDITSTIKVERALVDSEQKYRNLVEASHDLVWRIDVDKNFNFINNASSTILGYAPAELIGNSFINYVNPSKAEELTKVHEKVLEGQVFESFPIEMVTVKGEVRHLTGTAYPILDDNGKIVGCSGTATDITYLKNYQSQLEESLAEKEILIKEIHHRVKNNLAVISGLFALQAMYVKKEDAETLTILQESQSRIKSIAAIHEKLYQNHVFSSIEIKSYLTDVVSEIAETYERGDRHIEIEVLGDEVSLNVNQAVPFGILANELIVNAYKYAFDGKDDGKIEIILNAVGEELIFCVTDNGIGLAEDFDINELNSLGMTLIKTLSEQLNATFDWDTKKGEGVNFKVSFVPDKLIKSTWLKKMPEN